MSGHELVDRIRRLAKLNGWPMATRRGSGSHLTVYLTHDRGERMAIVPMHRGRDINPKAINVARGAIDKRVYVFGAKLQNLEGENIIVASVIEVFPSDDELPSIDEMVGILRGDK